MKLYPVFMAALVATAGFAQAQQALVPAGSELVFVSRQMGVPVEGRFRKFDAQVSFDPAKPAAARIKVVVDVASATLGVPQTDADLPKPVWFNTAKFPQAVFESSAVKAAGPGRYEVSGKLSLKGVTQDVVVPVTLTQAGTITSASGTIPLRRLVFKVGENEWADTSMVADEVQLRFKLNLSGVAKL